MGIVQAAGVALLSAMLALLLKELRAAAVPAVRLAGTLLLLGAALGLCAPILKTISELMALADGGAYTALLLRGVGIALIAELAASLCRDMGEGTVAEGVVLFGRLEILLLALPLLRELLNIAKELLQ